MRMHLPAFFAAGLNACGFAIATPQWRVVFLHPSGIYSSSISAINPALAGGRVTSANGVDRPFLWRFGSGESADLLPNGYRTGAVLGIGEQQQVGYISSTAGTHAVMWQGTPESVLFLTPPGSLPFAIGMAISGNQQVGYIAHVSTGYDHAALWYGTPESFVDLHPANALWSQAVATDGIRQGGRADIDLPNIGIHAALWSGSASTFVDMNPAGARESRILGMADGVQVGRALIGNYDHAVVWHGTPESCVDLHPPQAGNSGAFATTGTIHAGYFTAGGQAQACIWVGDDRASVRSLHALLDPRWIISGATSISVTDEAVYVGGVVSRDGYTSEAVLWIGPLPQPEHPRRTLKIAAPAEP